MAAKLVNAGWFDPGPGAIPTPQFTSDHKAHLDAGTFDGMAIYIRNSSLTIQITPRMMRPTTMTYADMMTAMSPYNALSFSHLTYNWAYVAVTSGTRPNDFFQDWAPATASWQNLAACCRDSGLQGIMFDPEQYAVGYLWCDWEGQPLYPGHTYQEYSDQTRLVAKGIMQAMVTEFPAIKVACLHGPYISEPQAVTPLGFNPAWPAANDLMGPFAVGLYEGIGTSAAKVIDGGELYHLRNLTDFESSKTWRKDTLPSAAINCAYIPLADRAGWEAGTKRDFGVYLATGGDGINDTATLRSTLANALMTADDEVWLYPDSMTFNLPPESGGATQAYIDAVLAAKSDAAPKGSAGQGLFLYSDARNQFARWGGARAAIASQIQREAKEKMDKEEEDARAIRDAIRRSQKS